MTADNSEALLIAAIDGSGIVMTPELLASPAVKAGSLVRILMDWHGGTNGGDPCGDASRAFGAREDACVRRAHRLCHPNSLVARLELVLA